MGEERKRKKTFIFSVFERIVKYRKRERGGKRQLISCKKGIETEIQGEIKLRLELGRKKKKKRKNHLFVSLSLLLKSKMEFVIVVMEKMKGKVAVAFETEVLV